MLDSFHRNNSGIYTSTYIQWPSATRVIFYIVGILSL